MLAKYNLITSMIAEENGPQWQDRDDRFPLGAHAANTSFISHCCIAGIDSSEIGRSFTTQLPSASQPMKMPT